MWCQLESASADPTRVSGEEIAPLDAKGWASVLPFQSLAKVGPRGEGAAWPPWQLPFNLAQVSIDRGSWEILEASTLPAGFPSGSDGKKKICLQCRDPGDPWVGKMPWRREWQPTPVFLPGESHGQRSCWATVQRVAGSDTTE